MQIRYSLTTLLLMLILSVSVKAQDASEQDSTGLPGDNFNLQGALEMFKKSASPEAFEKALNSEENKVNNLDLNDDGKTDYIRVVNKKEDDVQIFVLQALVSDGESQDVAVIQLQKTGDETAVIQIEGDRDIYGESKIAEPAEEAADNAFNYSSPATHGPSASIGSAIFVNVWFWPCVRFVYAPAYVVWVSPWTWHSHPVWWRPWRPMPWYAYRPHYHYYNSHYTYVYNRRIAPARNIYRPMRTTSVTVINRNRVVVNNYRVNNRAGYNNRSGYYNNNRSGSYNNNRSGSYNNNRSGNYNNNRSGSYNNNRSGNYSRPSQPSRMSNYGRSGSPNRNYQSAPNRSYQSSPNRSYRSQPSNPGSRGSQGSRPSGGNSRSGGRSRN